VQPMMRVVAFGVAALIVAGCSSDGTAAPTTSPVAVTVTTSVSDTTPSTAAPAPSSTSTTTVVTTTMSPTTTTVATEDQIKRAVQDYIAAYFACGQVPAQCDAAQFTARQGPSRATVVDLAEGMSAEGLYFSTDLRGSYLVAESVSKSSETSASAIYCAYDALTVLGPNGPDNLPTIVNDQILSYRYQYSVFLEDAEWRVGEQRQQEQIGEGNLCPPPE
jgi:hypothetical protein